MMNESNFMVGKFERLRTVAILVLKKGSVFYLIQSYATFFPICSQNMPWKLHSIFKMKLVWISPYNLCFENRLWLRPGDLTDVTMARFERFVHIVLLQADPANIDKFLSVVPV